MAAIAAGLAASIDAASIDAANAWLASLEAAHIAAVAETRRARGRLEARREAIVGPASARLSAFLNADAYDLAMIMASVPTVHGGCRDDHRFREK